MRARLYTTLIGFLLIGLSTTCGPIWAQPAAEPPADAQRAATEPAADEAAAVGDAAGEGDFASLFADWKETLTRLRELQVEYKSAPAADRPALEEEFKGLVAKGDELAPKLNQAAEAAYLAAPNKDQELGAYLGSALKVLIAKQDFAAANRLGALLIENKYPQKAVYNAVGVASLNAGDTAKALEYLTKAEQDKLLDEEGRACLAEAKIRDAEAKADDLPRVRLKTNKGDIVLELFENEAPNTVASYISLIENKFYDGLTFHRVLEGFMAQGGCPKGDGSSGPGYTIECECKQPNFRKHFAGSLSMAHAGEDSGGSQFFIMFGPKTHLNGLHTVFGRVIEGMDVVNSIQLRNPEEPNQPDPDTIVEATVLRKRDHAYEPVTLPDAE